MNFKIRKPLSADKKHEVCAAIVSAIANGDISARRAVELLEQLYVQGRTKWSARYIWESVLEDK